jgi:hypothetical protein
VEIQIQKEANRCIICGQAFAHEQKHYSLLKLEGEIFLREDYCEECWPKYTPDNGAGAIYSHWETRYRDPAAVKATPEGQFMPLLKLFYEHAAAGAPGDDAFCYVCALILRRQKVFRFIREEKEQDSNKNQLIFHDKYHDVQVKVPDPQVSEAEFQEVRRKLEEFLTEGKSG